MAGLDIYTGVASFLNADLSNESGISKTATDLRDAGPPGDQDRRAASSTTPPSASTELQQQRGAALVAVRKALS